MNEVTFEEVKKFVKPFVKHGIEIYPYSHIDSELGIQGEALEKFSVAFYQTFNIPSSIFIYREFGFWPASIISSLFFLSYYGIYYVLLKATSNVNLDMLFAILSFIVAIIIASYRTLKSLFFGKQKTLGDIVINDLVNIANGRKIMNYKKRARINA